MKFGISIPTYNEATNIKILLTKIQQELAEIKDLEVQVVVVDDSSPDGTAEIVTKCADKLNTSSFKVSLLSRTAKDGFGRACVAGFNKLLEEKVDYVMQMDADLSHNPTYLPAFVKAARDGRDFVVGTRYIKGGETPDWPWIRRFLSKYGNAYARIILSPKVSDYTGGFNMYSADLLRRIDLNSLRATGYGFLIELKYSALRQSKNMYQIPIVFTDRQHGTSKIPKSTLFKNMFLVPAIRLSYRKKS